MIAERGLNQTLRKLQRLEQYLHGRIFDKVGEAALLGFYQTAEPLDAIPPREFFGPTPADGQWGGEGMYGWFIAEYIVPEHLAGKPLFLFPRIGGYEGTLWADGEIIANFACKEIIGSHGNHYAKRFTGGAQAGQRISLALEYYAYHDMPGGEPFGEEGRTSYRYPLGPLNICVQDPLHLAYWADLRTLLDLVAALPDTSFRRADVLHTLYQVHARVLYDEAHAPAGAFRRGLEETHPLLQTQLAKRNGPTAPFVGLVGHSHMDTAWLWPMTETVKKCVRTYANQLSLMEQYPEYRFVQSSAYHAEMVRRSSPALFARIQAAVAAGRYEPNGGVWVEGDGNLAGGEYMARQFLWGQRYTQKHFGYRADTFWLPDTFGYSFSLPQIMLSCGIKYFLTTKMSWNDTNKFPYTSFLWQGLDGSRVLTHLNRLHLGPDPHMLNDLTMDGHITGDPIPEKTCTDMRLFSYGKGDGGGGPEFEMIEMARRLGDLEGVARSSHISVSAFMHRLEESARDLSVYAGELYLELHRGTLTNQHNIKRNNRLAEMALHGLELLTVHRAVKHGQIADGTAIDPLTETLLVNQFHDILPGTCIHSVHQTSLEQTGALIGEASAMALEALETDGDPANITLLNPLSFARSDVLYLPNRPGKRIAGGYVQQRVTNVHGEGLLAVAGVVLPAFGSTVLQWESGEPEDRKSPFNWEGDTLITPFARVAFDVQGAISSYIDLASGRELRDPDRLPWNTFLMAEDVSAAWDSWDIDADLEAKFVPEGRLLSREVVSEGPVELRIRSRYALTEQTLIEQDMIFYADSPLIAFDTVMEWQETHRFLKVAFDTALVTDGARHEIQFGHIRRSNHRSTSEEKARFEVCNHKFTDLSEGGFGIALLNDCKYGISVEEGSMRLSLHKGGNRPDREGDRGRHLCRYALLPHEGGFSAENVVHPAYAFNCFPIIKEGTGALASLVTVDAPNVIIETVKPCEDADTAYILRLYEAAGAYTNATLTFGHPVHGLTLTNMLEETQNEQPMAITFRPFEIKTLRVAY